MLIGIPKEVNVGETRVAGSPETAKKLLKLHAVMRELDNE